MRSSCKEHNSEFLSCGCSVMVLENDEGFWEQIRAKDKWIKELLKEIEELKVLNVSDEDLL